MVLKNQNIASEGKSASHPAFVIKRGYSRVEAAAYIGISPSLFDEMMGDGRMPKPVRINSRVLWDIKDLDAAFEDLKGAPLINSWDNL